MTEEKPRRDYDDTERKMIAEGREADAKVRWTERKFPHKMPKR